MRTKNIKKIINATLKVVAPFTNTPDTKEEIRAKVIKNLK